MHQTMQACFGHRTRSIPSDRPIPSSRRDPFAQRGVSRLTRYNPSRRLLSRRMKWRSIGTHDPTTINIHPASAPDTNPPGHGRVRAPGSPLAPSLGTAVTPNLHPPTPKFGGPACMRPGARGPFAVRPVSGRPAAPGPPARPPNLGCRRVWVRGHGSACGGVPGGHGRAPGSGWAGVRGNLRDEC